LTQKKSRKVNKKYFDKRKELTLNQENIRNLATSKKEYTKKIKVTKKNVRLKFSTKKMKKG